jgi:hypothetical protein
MRKRFLLKLSLRTLDQLKALILVCPYRRELDQLKILILVCPYRRELDQLKALILVCPYRRELDQLKALILVCPDRREEFQLVGQHAYRQDIRLCITETLPRQSSAFYLRPMVDLLLRNHY